MNDIEGRKDRYMRGTLPIRMGGLAANLARVSSFSEIDGARVAVIGLIEESKYFIEWTALEYDISTTVELIDIQRLLAKWHFNIDRIWNDATRRKEIGNKSKELSDKLLTKSGLLDQ